MANSLEKNTGRQKRNQNDKQIKTAQTEPSQRMAAKIAAISAAVFEKLSDKRNYRIISICKSNNWKR